MGGTGAKILETIQISPSAPRTPLRRSSTLMASPGSTSVVSSASSSPFSRLVPDDGIDRARAAGSGDPDKATLSSASSIRSSVVSILRRILSSCAWLSRSSATSSALGPQLDDGDLARLTSCCAEQARLAAQPLAVQLGDLPLHAARLHRDAGYRLEVLAKRLGLDPHVVEHGLLCGNLRLQVRLKLLERGQLRPIRVPARREDRGFLLDQLVTSGSEARSASFGGVGNSAASDSSAWSLATRARAASRCSSSTSRFPRPEMRVRGLVSEPVDEAARKADGLEQGQAGLVADTRRAPSRGRRCRRADTRRCRRRRRACVRAPCAGRAAR